MTSSSHPPSEMRLYDRAKHRLYINTAERHRFLETARQTDPTMAAFCLTLLYTGCRISEALELNTGSLQLETRIITFRTLKRRDDARFREVPVPQELADRLSAVRELAIAQGGTLLWTKRHQPLNRATAYRWIKAVMHAAHISGAQACPKGLRHGYGIHAIQSGVQLNMLQKWMGHASMSTTAIYANAIGDEELAIADRMWADTSTE